ncbi:hypothetical protein [Streptomyces lavendofoliae]|uniref:Uncharacterized protein n=1 Tax=Streptomyces lavendofoliae TaxID=67314 RepID=A0A918I4F6_9ACTN|nr:hypothetical protein [Streptomyces lavendofoliae]GGU62180.1 hypothetical protein GCM10010274_58690 [Streptomyces lavendofoliae]
MTYTPADAQADTMGVWDRRQTQYNRPRIPVQWTQTTAADGTPLISGRLISPGAADALLRFVREGTLTLAYHAGACQQPTFDTTVTGRTVCAWRTGGVWVELWHPDTAPKPARPTAPSPSPATVPQAAPGIAPAPVSRLAALLRTRAGDRLPTRRTRKPALTKEN